MSAVPPSHGRFMPASGSIPWVSTDLSSVRKRTDRVAVSPSHVNTDVHIELYDDEPASAVRF